LLQRRPQDPPPLTPLGLVALILGVLGSYGVISYSVGQRTYEVGIRMALGASNREVMRMVLLQGLRPSIIGAVAGLTLALSVQPLLDTPEFSYVNPRDPTV
jgi:ABC-type lipoprotein release transport system permease subunit